MPGSADSERACSMIDLRFLVASMLTAASVLEARQCAEIRIGDRDHLEQLAHLGAAFAEQALDGAVDLVGLVAARHRP